MESAIKCLNNAERLFNDAMRVSKPTAIGLIEIAIEEIAKGVILVPKIEGVHSRSPNNDPLLKEIFKDKSGNKFDIMDVLKDLNIKKYKIDQFNFLNHKDKLNLINNLVKIFSSISPIIVDMVDINALIQNFNFVDSFPIGFKEKVEFKEKFLEMFSEISSTDIDKLDYMKQQGFYVDINGKSSKAPLDNSFDMDKILKIFTLCYIALNLYIKFNEGFDLKKIFENKGMTLGFISNYVNRNVWNTEGMGTGKNPEGRENERT